MKGGAAKTGVQTAGKKLKVDGSEGTRKIESFFAKQPVAAAAAAAAGPADEDDA